MGYTQIYRQHGDLINLPNKLLLFHGGKLFMLKVHVAPPTQQKCAGWVRLYVYVGLCFEKETVGKSGLVTRLL
jgi:hypothetical protein